MYKGKHTGKRTGSNKEYHKISTKYWIDCINNNSSSYIKRNGLVPPGTQSEYGSEKQQGNSEIGCGNRNKNIITKKDSKKTTVIDKRDEHKGIEYN